VKVLDDAVGAIVASLRRHGMYNSSLVLFSSDNGGPTFGGGPPSANNWPLLGSKLSDWEGGIRLAAAVGVGLFRWSFCSTAQSICTRFPIIFTSCFSEVTCD
jgi:hypothetical protein